ncbi:MAG: hypothetical protein UX17_C0007G0010 [Parcubacteria group bacterium GW2011_GWC2_45_7]|nr:MAG: hypothetical protein UX17_C0007G0010 [Parcubacteria group bacterium GW2011_GWC2_45_7]KKU73828.1 MAG: hypothetical protein UX98_C0004G0027 [Parcubacteria group bacterium GW2011_GWA2_47_26]
MRVSFPPKDGEEDDGRSILMNIKVEDGAVWVLPDELQDKDE